MNRAMRPTLNTLAAPVMLCAVLMLLALRAPCTAATTLPTGFSETVYFGGLLLEPTAVQFASDGRIFIAEKSGLIKEFDSLTDPTPTIFADLRTNVFNYWDRGLLGLALDPNFPTNPYVYIAYTLTLRSAVRRRCGELWVQRRTIARPRLVRPQMDVSWAAAYRACKLMGARRPGPNACSWSRGANSFPAIAWTTLCSGPTAPFM